MFWHRKSRTATTSSDDPQDPATITLDDSHPKTVIVFGTTGVGKSSVINMLPDDLDHLPSGTLPKQAVVSSSVNGVTARPEVYLKTIGGQRFRVHDTSGMGESAGGTVRPETAVKDFHDLLAEQREINLVVLVVRSGRLGQMEKNNMELIKLLCGKDAPIALVVTGVEQESAPEEWWNNQKKAGHWAGDVEFKGCVCVVATKGKDDSLESLYESSKPRLESLLASSATRPGLTAYGKPWIGGLVYDVRRLAKRSKDNAKFSKDLFKLLQSYGVEKWTAQRVVREIRQLTWRIFE